MCKICLKRTLDATFLDCLALTFCDVIGELLSEWAWLTLQGGTTFHPSVQDLQDPRLGKPRRGLQILDTRIRFPRPSLNVVLDSINLEYDDAQYNIVINTKCLLFPRKWSLGGI